MNNSVNGVCMRQDALAADVQRLTGETGTSNTLNRLNNTRMSRIAKIEFPKFYGDDPTGWVYRSWHQQFNKIHGETVDWNVYVEALLKRFSICYEDPMSDLKNIRQQGGLVQVYIDAFDLIMTKPQSLADAYCLSKLQETNNNVSKKLNKPLVTTTKPVYNNYGKSSGTPTQTAHYTPPRPKPIYNNAPYKKQLTHGRFISLEIMEESRGVEEGLGVSTFQTMRVNGQINNKPVNILIDCGSTHNFLDLSTAKKMGCSVKESYPLHVAVPGGNFLISKHEILFVIFCKSRWNKMALRRVPQPALQWMQSKQLGAKLFSMAVCVYPNSGLQAELMMPSSLPPHKKHDHKIPLQANIVPINIRPYRHPPIQKDAIEAMVTELLKSERMCVDYRALNKKTVKDKFPIPIIEELIDELCGAQVFNKLDLSQVEYLGHVIFGKRVSTNPSKVKAMQEWLVPVNIKKLRGLLGLTRYYMRFIKGYATISKPLTALLKKNSFKWSEAAQQAFEDLKAAMLSAPVLALPNFHKEFTLVIDASDDGIGAVLQQQGHPIAFLMFEISNDLLLRIQESWLIDPSIQQVIKQAKDGGSATTKCNWQNEQLRRNAYPLHMEKTVILVVVDRLSKYAHFIPLSHPFKAAQIAQVFLDSIYKLHGLPQTITNDRDKVFLSHFWKELFERLEVTFQLSIAYHPQTDGKSKVVNRCLECYLRCMTTINTTPFKVVYGQKPPTHVSYMAGDSQVEAVDRSLRAREDAISLLQFHLERAQHRMKTFADKNMSDRTFYSSFFKGDHETQIQLPHCTNSGLITAVPVATIDRKIAKVSNAAFVYWLVQWSNRNEDDATWEVATEIEAKYPDFNADS
nr:hypothetical protein [Tanacetum cinerariifolium]